MEGPSISKFDGWGIGVLSCFDETEPELMRKAG